ncbi:hypothetical protein AUR64_19475 [Haloprofundus marisrubri]|uniref:Uncharacterized protein n=1 Tax=Haloprofundus marisrubri TaxID=1514971 RepID=A0A0W1R587_9EURY|nr:hypothetical protein [Haloprofundus marisrubri]KTG08411.1 hypothetical protein AUR64_19475 [Haloprofundus marisrubri]
MPSQRKVGETEEVREVEETGKPGEDGETEEAEEAEEAEETRARAVDVTESLALLLVPTLLVGGSVALFAGSDSATGGLLVGGMFGAILMGLRRGFYAVRTESGVERRLRTYDAADDNNPWVRLASVEYPEKYDRFLALGLAVLGVGAFALVPFVGGGFEWGIRFVAVGLFGVVSSLLVVGVSHNQAD